MKESTTVFLLNVAMFTGWISLAVHFDKWWIALFVLFTLFRTGEEK